MHNNAFGVEIQEENIDSLIKLCNSTNLKKEVSIDVKVDKIEHKVDTNRVQYGHYLRALTNQHVDDVLYGYKNIKINTGFVRSRGSVTTIWERGLEFIIFNDHSVVGDWLRCQGKFLNVDIVGKPTINYWMGSGKPQIVVERIQLSK